MICKSAGYINFRNIADQKIEFCDGVNVICGDNAQGKTNALEGIYLHAACRSHRAAKDREMIGFSGDFARVTLDYSSGGRENELDMTITSAGRKICRKNSLVIKRASDYIGNFRAVLFTPGHLSVVKDGPSERRNFLDSALCQLYPSYMAHLRDFNRLLLQRNRLLSMMASGEISGGDADANLDVWTEKLAFESEFVSRMRSDYTEKLSSIVADIFEDMTSGGEKVRLSYVGGHTADEYRELFSKARRKEIAAGTTLYGVHRDDIGIYLNENAVRAYGSQGQQRSVSLAMKLAEGEISKQITGEYPVFLLDDILSELDERRKSYIMSGLDKRQVIITACSFEKSFEGARLIVCKGVRYGETQNLTDTGRI